jgi:metallo-beta-lactamase class B VIM
MTTFRCRIGLLAAALAIGACSRPADPPETAAADAEGAAEAAPESLVHAITPDLSVTVLADGVWMHTSWRTLTGGTRFPSNGLIVRDGDELILIDTAWGEEPTEALLAWIDTTLALPVARVISTHFHDDRVGGGEAVRRRGIPHLATALTGRLAAEVGNPVPDPIAGIDSIGAVARIGAVEVFYPGPAHTRDNVVVHIPSAGVLFGGCAVRELGTRSRGNVADGDTLEWPASIARARDRYAGVRLVVPGHGEVGGAELLDHTISLFRR